MKNILFLITYLFSISVGIAQSKNYCSIEVTVRNAPQAYVFIIKGLKVIKKISINKDGFGKDTIKVTNGFYDFTDGIEFTQIYLKKGFDLKLSVDSKTFDETLRYYGNGSLENNFLAENILENENFDFQKMNDLSEQELDVIVEQKTKATLSKLSKSMNASFVRNQKQTIPQSNARNLNKFLHSKSILKLKNTIAPDFEYINFDGSRSKLSDFRGKYIYIDVWATWCAPCRSEIPSLKRIEAKYHSKNILFLSISIDVEQDFEKWKTFIIEKQLGGTQLFANNSWLSDFMVTFKINSIPRFIIIDPSGKVVDANAARPSNPELQILLDKLLM